ncbi:alpha/beta hydrolase [Allocoleopsis sp.]|uniref:alpha/beta hydrolase n=1 Tax=Allocoleopsis sp. TaxID=3088169 RepID=UPI002FCF9FFC
MNINVGVGQGDRNLGLRDYEGDWRLGKQRRERRQGRGWLPDGSKAIPLSSLSAAPRLGKLSAGLGIALVNLGVLIAPVVVSTPAQGAERIYLTYGPLELSLSIKSLSTYARVGKIDRELAAYTDRLNPQQLEQLRKILQTPVDVKPLAIAQFLYSSQGKVILDRVGQIIQTKAGQPGFYAIRSALIQAAAAPDGLTLLNVLEKFPTYGIRINSVRGFQVLEELSNLIQETQLAIAAVEQQALTEASAQASQREAAQPFIRPSDHISPKGLGRESGYFSKLPDLRKPGEIQYSKETLTLYDPSRQRRFPVDLYLPQQSGRPAPLVVISHGLGSDRMTFAYLAAHLASYGFAVAVPEHPGSNAAQLQALINGLASEVTPPAELIDRPLDIKFLLDELKRSFAGRVNLQQVGVLGQSFGGYTVLALTGAKIDFDLLNKECGPSNDSLNLSLLLQCRAIELLARDYQLSDERVKAGIAINPVGSTLFGKSQFSQIQVPLMLVAGSDDTVAPALPEQIQPFTWLTTPNKYLVLLKGGTHFSTLERSENDIPLPPQVLGSDPSVAQNYMKALSLAFFETYIINNSDYRVYLSASYAQYLSRSVLPLSLVESLTEEQLKQAKRAEDSTPIPTPTPTPTPIPTPSPSPVPVPTP